MFEEFTPYLINIDTLKGMPFHIGNVSQERFHSHAVALVQHETVGVAFELQPLREKAAVLVEKIMREIDGTSQTHTLAKEVEEFAPTHKANVLHPYVKTLVFDSLEIPQGEGVVVAIGEEDSAERVSVA